MNGILLVDKPLFYTSHDVVDAIRRKSGLRRVGHAGTLDPMATGLLVVLIGSATGFFSRYAADDKEYEGSMTLGIETDTQDLEGRILRWETPPPVGEAEVREAFRRRLGIRPQRVPLYSAARIGGKKAYALARAGRIFVPPVKQVEVKSFVLRAFGMPEVFFSACVSKGTYVRALCDEIGKELGTGAVLSALRRTRSGGFYLRDGAGLDELTGLSADRFAARLIPASDPVPQ